MRWQFRYGKPKLLGERKFDDSYRGRLLRKVTAGGKDYILCVASHKDYFPTQVVLLDADTGEPVSEYFHPGAFYSCLLIDIDGDGNDEVILGGVNNPGPGMGHAALAAFKVPFPLGGPASLPATPEEAIFREFTGGGEYKYLLFPRTDVSSALGTLPTIGQLSFPGTNRILAKSDSCIGGFLTYYLDFSFHVIGEVQVSDNLLQEHIKLRREGMLSHDHDANEKERWGKILPFPSAPNGNGTEIKRFFMEELKR